MNLHYKKSFSDWLFDVIVYLLVSVVLIVTLYPLIYVVSMSISDPIEAARGHVWLLPKGFDLTAIRAVLSDSEIFRYYGNTIWYAVVGTTLGVVFTCLAAYPLSRKEFTHRDMFMKFIMFTMFFSGGMIPTFIVVSRFLHLYNTRWAVILTSLTTAWYITVARSFFLSLPDEIVECARLDGASEYRIFAQLVMPLSKPIIGVLALYNAVGHWNSYFSHMLYEADQKLHPLALYIRKVVIQNSVAGYADAFQDMTTAQILSAIQLKYAVIVISVLPMLLIYPFISGNLEKGLMIGAVKG